MNRSLVNYLKPGLIINNYKSTITVINTTFFLTTTPPSYTSRDDDDDEDEGSKSCFKLPENRVCYSPRYGYRGIRYKVVRVKTHMGLERFEVGKILSLNSQSLGIYEGI